MKKTDSSQEKRQNVRFRVLSLVKLAGESGDIPLQAANIQDISRGGLSFLTEKEIPEGVLLQLYFLPLHHKKPVEVRGKVAQCSRFPKNKAVFKVGVRFLEVSDETNLAIQKLEASFLGK